MRRPVEQLDVVPVQLDAAALEQVEQVRLRRLRNLPHSARLDRDIGRVAHVLEDGDRRGRPLHDHRQRREGAVKLPPPPPPAPPAGPPPRPSPTCSSPPPWRGAPRHARDGSPGQVHTYRPCTSGAVTRTRFASTSHTTRNAPSPRTEQSTSLSKSRRPTSLSS